MAATVTLATTTLGASLSLTDTIVRLASGTSVTPGLRLFVDQELMTVDRAAPSSSNGNSCWIVLRGKGGAGTQQHSSGSTVYIGRADQFYSVDPKGAPSTVVPVSPYINTFNGNVWLPQGDEAPEFPGAGWTPTRWWQLVTFTYGQGALGVRTTTQTPSTSN